MKRKRRISRLKRENRRLRKENKQLHNKHWSECRQISAYDEENRKLRLALLIISSSVSEQPEEPEKPKKTYKEDFLEKFPNAPISRTGCPHGCVYHAYGNRGVCRATCSDCWNEVMPDE